MAEVMDIALVSHSMNMARQPLHGCNITIQMNVAGSKAEVLMHFTMQNLSLALQPDRQRINMLE